MHANEPNQPPRRCAWAGNDALYVSYHDEEWGRPLDGEAALWRRWNPAHA